MAPRKKTTKTKVKAQSPDPPVLNPLKDAIRSLDVESARHELEFLRVGFPEVNRRLQERLLVRGKDIVRYHIDTDFEDDEYCEIEEDSDSDSDDSVLEKTWQRKAEEEITRASTPGRKNWELKLEEEKRCLLH